MLLSCCCKGLDLDDDDIDEDEEKVRVAENSLRVRESKMSASTEFHPIDEVILASMRKARIEEAEMKSIVKEIIGYGVFILLIYFISYGNRHPMSYTLKNQINEAFITDPGFDQIVTSNDWWNWIHSTAVDALRAQRYYNGMPAYGLRGFIGDKTNRIMGYGVLRQVRVKPNTCQVDSRVKNITQECAQVRLHECHKNQEKYRVALQILEY